MMTQDSIRFKFQDFRSYQWMGDWILRPRRSSGQYVSEPISWKVQIRVQAHIVDPPYWTWLWMIKIVSSINSVLL